MLDDVDEVQREPICAFPILSRRSDRRENPWWIRSSEMVGARIRGLSANVDNEMQWHGNGSSRGA